MKSLTRFRQYLFFLCLMSSTIAFSAEQPRLIEFKPGEVGLLTFLATVSDKLDIQIDASTVGTELGTITVPNVGPVTPERAREVVLTSLYLMGFTWIHDSAIDVYRIVSERDARDLEIPVIADASLLPDSDLLVSFIMKLEHAPPESIARTMRSFMPANSRIIPDEGTASVMITDSAHNIAKLRKLVEQLDTPEAGRQTKEWLSSSRKTDPCPNTFGFAGNSGGQSQGVLIALFSLMALVIGFLMRGYVIRRIEGGL